LKVLFIGFGDLAARAASRCIAAGWQVSGLKRSPAVVDNVNIVNGDCRDSELMARLVADHDLVIVSLTPDSYTEEGYRQAYVEPARVLRNAVEHSPAPPGLILWVSSTSVYGKGQGELVDENTPATPGGFSGEALLESEQIVAGCSAPTSVIRCSGIYGPGRERMIRLVKEGQCAPASPVQWSNRIHADDCGGVLFHLAQKFFTGESIHPLYIATDCMPVPLHDVHRWLAEQHNVPFGTRESSIGRGNRRCSNERLIASGYQFIYPTYREGYRALMQPGSW